MDAGAARTSPIREMTRRRSGRGGVVARSRVSIVPPPPPPCSRMHANRAPVRVWWRTLGVGGQVSGTGAVPERRAGMMPLAPARCESCRRLQRRARMRRPFVCLGCVAVVWSAHRGASLRCGRVTSRWAGTAPDGAGGPGSRTWPSRTRAGCAVGAVHASLHWPVRVRRTSMLFWVVKGELSHLVSSLCRGPTGDCSTVSLAGALATVLSASSS